MKKCLYYIIAFAVCPALTARAYDDCRPCGNVSVSSIPYTFAVQFRALILKPSTSNLHYAAQATTLPAPSPRWTIYDIHPTYHFGFDLGVRSSLFNDCRSLGINWEHFNSTSENSHTAPAPTDMIGPFFEIGPEATPYQNSTGRTKFNFNTVHVNVAQFVEFGNLETHFFGGVNFTSLKQTTTSFFSSTNGNTTRSIIAPISFKGAGPEFGACFDYDIFCGLSLSGKLAAAILIGKRKNDTLFSSVSPVQPAPPIGPITYPNLQTVITDKMTIVVPVFEQRIGAAYEARFWCTYTARLEVGYEARVYFNALQQIDVGSEVSNVNAEVASVGVFARTFRNNVSNFALTGPYVAFNMTF
ncbi:MAG: Lpg1974 family pore-forming outer membrane protein [Candidatus Babeliales bacterium]